MNSYSLPPPAPPRPPSERIFPDIREADRAGGAISVSALNADDVPHAMARPAVRWVSMQLGGTIPWAELTRNDIECLRSIASSWHRPSPMELALLPDARRAWVAALQELVELLAQSPQGRQALADFGFEPLLENVKSP